MQRPIRKRSWGGENLVGFWGKSFSIADQQPLQGAQCIHHTFPWDDHVTFTRQSLWHNHILFISDWLKPIQTVSLWNKLKLLNKGSLTSSLLSLYIRFCPIHICLIGASQWKASVMRFQIKKSIFQNRQQWSYSAAMRHFLFTQHSWLTNYLTAPSGALQNIMGCLW